MFTGEFQGQEEDDPNSGSDLLDLLESAPNRALATAAPGVDARTAATLATRRRERTSFQ